METRFNKFTQLIVNINRKIQKIKNKEMLSIGLKGNQVQCIYYLYNLKDGASPSQLTTLCGEDKGAISRTLKQLEKQDYLYVEEKQSQKYRNPIKLTKRGLEIGKIISDKINKFVALGSTGITEKGRDSLYESLMMIDSNLEKVCNSYN